MSYIKRSEKFLADIDLTEGETSNIWDSLRKDFQIPNNIQKSTMSRQFSSSAIRLRGGQTNWY